MCVFKCMRSLCVYLKFISACDVRMVYCGDYKINYLKLFSLDGYLMQSAELGGVIPTLAGKGLIITYI